MTISWICESAEQSQSDSRANDKMSFIKKRLLCVDWRVNAFWRLLDTFLLKLCCGIYMRSLLLLFSSANDDECVVCARTVLSRCYTLYF